MKRLTVVVAVVVALLVSAGVALAAWTIGSTGASGRAAARTLPTGPTPTALQGGSTVTVSFTQVALGSAGVGSLTGGGYTVRRYSSGGVAQTVGSACNLAVSGSAATLSCAEANVPAGTWSYKVTPFLSGWTGVEGASGTVTVVTAPPAPSTPALAAASDSGSSSTDGITDITTPTVTGTAQAGSTVTIYDGTTAVGTAVATGAGAYSVTTATLAQGAHSLTARAANAAGPSPASGALPVSIDTTAPGVTVTLSNGGGTSKITAAGTGSTSDGKVTLYLCHTTPCSAGNAAYQNTALTVAAGGTWTFTTQNIGTGTYYATAQQTDTAGNTGTGSYGPFTR